MKTTSFATRTFTPAIRAGGTKALAKRVFDVVLAAVGLLLTLPVMVAIALAIRLVDGAPVFYVSERMRTADDGFNLLKFRTMRATRRPPRQMSWRDASRVTRLGQRLRTLRLDELPQLWNVLRGEMSLVGPRPPLRQQVLQDPVLYGRILKQKPGLTGLATLAVYGIESGRLLRLSTERDAVEYHRRVLLPRKAFLDQTYGRNQTVLLDASILFCTVLRVAMRGRRVRPLRRSRRDRGGFRIAIF